LNHDGPKVGDDKKRWLKARRGTLTITLGHPPNFESD